VKLADVAGPLPERGATPDIQNWLRLLHQVRSRSRIGFWKGESHPTRWHGVKDGGTRPSANLCGGLCTILRSLQFGCLFSVDAARFPGCWYSC